jgi:hypothetical protein
MEKQKVYNLVILDESGSMEVIKNPTISGFNELVQTVKEVEKQYPEQEHYISLVTFNGIGVRTKLDKAPVSELEAVDAKSYQPNSSTPLFDAMGLSIMKLRYDTIEQKNTAILVSIFTDGEENASREFTGQQIRNLVNELKSLGWTFTYIGANHDVEKAAMSVSITNTMTFSADTEGVKKMFIREKSARMNYSQNLRDKKDVAEDYYKEGGKS